MKTHHMAIIIGLAATPILYAQVPLTLQEQNQPALQNNFVENVEVKGQITAINDNILTINVFETEHFQPGGNTVEADIQYAQFKHGNRADLRQNALVEIEAIW
ncbi:secreted protein, partial [Candidatus Thiomargarita nelsonii]